MFLLMVLTPLLSGCGGENTSTASITSQDAGTWRGSIHGRNFSTDSVPDTKQTGPITMEIKVDRSFTAKLTVTTYEPGSTTTVHSVRDVVLSAELSIAPASYASNITYYTGTLTLDGKALPIKGELTLFPGGGGEGPLSLSYNYNDGDEWAVSARLKK